MFISGSLTGSGDVTHDRSLVGGRASCRRQTTRTRRSGSKKKRAPFSAARRRDSQPPKWNREETGSHHYDENLAEVSLITRDAFEPSLPLSVVVHIDYRKAPLVVQRFGDIKRLVEQTLDPMVSAYFKNIAQRRTVIQLLQDRSAIQQQAGEEMKGNFERYNLELQEVLIGTPTAGKGGGHANGDGLGGGNNVLQALLALLLSERMGVDVAPTSPLSAEAQSMREQLRTQISSTAPARS